MPGGQSLKAPQVNRNCTCMASIEESAQFSRSATVHAAESEISIAQPTVGGSGHLASPLTANNPHVAPDLRTHFVRVCRPFRHLSAPVQRPCVSSCRL